MPPKCKFIHANHHRCKAMALKGFDVCAKHKAVAEEHDYDDDDVALLPLPPVEAVAQRKVFNDALVEENLKLKCDIYELTNQMENLLKSTKDTKAVAGGKAKKRNAPSEKLTWYKARFLYYQNMKKNPELLSNILTRLKASDLIGMDAMLDDIPWSLIKNVTDHLFDGQDVAERKKYFDMAYDILKKKMES